MNNQLRALRERHNLTQAALADLLEVSRQTVNALETGRYDPSLPLAFRIAALFGEPIESVFQPEQNGTDGRRALDKLPLPAGLHNSRPPRLRSAVGSMAPAPFR